MIYATDRVPKHCEKRSLPRSCAGITPRMMVRGVKDKLMGFEDLIITLTHAKSSVPSHAMPMKFFIFLYGLLAMGLQAMDRPNILVRRR